MLTVHHLENSRSQRVLWLLEELEVPYELVRYRRDPATMQAPPELTRIHPLGKSPVVTDDARGEVLAESGAIIETLIERHGEGRLAPAPGTPEFQRYRYFLHYAEGSAMPPLLLKLVFDRMASADVPFFVKPVVEGIVRKVNGAFIGPQLKKHLDFMEGVLTHGPWFTGEEFSGADIQMSFPVEAAASRGGLDESRPRLMDWLARIHARPAYQRAISRGGPFKIG